MSSLWKHPFFYLWSVLAPLCLIASSSSARDLYWTEQKQILASDIDGQNETVIFDGETSSPPMESYAVDIAVTDTHIYWSGHSGGDIWRANRDGSEPMQLINVAGGLPHFLEISETTGKIYFSDFSNGLYSADLADGGNLNHFYSDSSPGNFSGLALDPSTTSGVDELLWISANSNWFYRSIPDWFSTSAESQLEGGNSTYGLAFHAGSRTLYYTNFSEGTLRSYNLDTSVDELLRPDLFQPLGVKLSPGGDHLLIVERGAGIGAYRISDRGYERIIPAIDAHFGVAATADPVLNDPTFPPPPPEPPQDGDLLFFTDFDEEGQSPDAPALTEEEGGPWSQFGTPADGTGLVVADTEDAFGRGTGNQFLQITSVRNFNFVARFHPTDILTFSFDYIGRVNEIDGNRWGNFNIRADRVRAHIVSPRPMSTEFRVAGPYPENDVPLRVDTILNNSAETITYDTPDGGTAQLAPTMASMWLYHYTTGQWEQLAAEHRFVRKLGDTEFGEILDNIHFQFDSDPDLLRRRSMDLDNIYVFKGAALGALFEAPGGGGAAGYSAWVGSHFSEAEQGDASVSGPEADPDGDGIENLVEYALGLDPRQSGVDGLPVTGLDSFTVGGETNQYLILEVTRPDSIEDVGYEVQVAGELTNWGTGAVLEESISNQDGTTTYIYRDSVPVNAEGRRFMALSISQN